MPVTFNLAVGAVEPRPTLLLEVSTVKLVGFITLARSVLLSSYDFLVIYQVGYAIITIPEPPFPPPAVG